jgi:TonB family protein
MMAKTHKQNTWKLLFLIPLAGSMLYLHACSQQEKELPAAPEILEMAQVDAPPQFTDCATDISVEEQMNCLHSGLVKLISENLVYPEIAREAKLEGRVFIQFLIDETGTLKSPELMRGIPATPGKEAAAEALNQAALEVFAHFPKMKPAQKDGKPVAIKYVVPINYALPKPATAFGPHLPPIKNEEC